MIALLCPTRKRASQCKRMVDSVNKTSDETSIYLTFDEKERGEYAGIVAHKMCLPDGMPTAHKWNELAQLAMVNPSNKLFMLAADDMIFTTPDWDKALLEHYSALGNKVHLYSFQDSRDQNGTPHPIFTREWIEFWGYMVNPIYNHWYVDTHAVTVAKSAGCFTHMRDYLLVHDKPSDRNEGDETHNKIRTMGWKQRDDFVWNNTLDYLELDKEKLSRFMQ